MRKIGFWQVNGQSLARVPEAKIELEKDLEGWIEADPSLLQGGIEIVGRQISLPGGRLDLLGLDPQGRWVVIEIKRGDLQREVVAQVFDYAACLSELPLLEFRQPIDQYLIQRGKSLDALLEQRDALEALDPSERRLVLFVVGTGRAAGLERMANFLSSKFGVPLSIISFDVFCLENGQKILAREVTELESPAQEQQYPSQYSMLQVLKLAERNDTGTVLNKFLDISTKLGFYAKAWKYCIMFAPMANKTRALFTVWVQRVAGKMKLWIGNDVFNQFYGIDQTTVAQELGPEGWRELSDDDVDNFIVGLSNLFPQASKNE